MRQCVSAWGKVLRLLWNGPTKMSRSSLTAQLTHDMNRTLRASDNAGRGRADEEIARSGTVGRHDDAIGFEPCGFFQDCPRRVGVFDQSRRTINLGDLAHRPFGFLVIKRFGLALEKILFHKSGGHFQHCEHCNGATLSQQGSRRNKRTMAFDVVTRGNWQNNIFCTWFRSSGVIARSQGYWNLTKFYKVRHENRIRVSRFRCSFLVFQNIFRALSTPKI